MEVRRLEVMHPCLDSFSSSILEYTRDRSLADISWCAPYLTPAKLGVHLTTIHREGKAAGVTLESEGGPGVHRAVSFEQKPKKSRSRRTGAGEQE